MDRCALLYKALYRYEMETMAEIKRRLKIKLDTDE